MKKFFKDLISDKLFLKTSLVFLIGQACLYWTIKLFQGRPIYISYFLDDKIPFIGQFIYVYNLFYPFCFISLFFLYKNDKQAYFKGLISCILGIIICDIIYLIVPTIMYRPPLPETDIITNFLLKVTFFFDNPPLNCFPSIHCLFCFQLIYSFIFSKANTKTKVINILCALLIILSTLLVKQHYFFDVVSALIIIIMTNFITEIFNLYQRLQKKVNSRKKN